jgi:outer membrane protein OmpA-like peptidoglycan-associated protein/predicted negative regulator of RcsB-dependent stress response
MNKSYSILILFVFGVLLTFAQKKPKTYSTTNEKAIKYYEESKKYFAQYKDKEAEEYLTKALQKDDNFIEAHSAYAQLLVEKKRFSEAVTHLKKAISINPDAYPANFFMLANISMIQGDYETAYNSYKKFLSYKYINPDMKEIAEREIKNAEFGMNAVKHPQEFKPINIGSSINTAEDEYFPSITADGETFIFTRKVGQQEDFYISTKVNGKWQAAVSLKEINSYGNEGAPSISADGKIMFFASCMNIEENYGSPDRKGYGSCDIFYSERINGKWSKPVNVGPPINTQHWETQPSFSSDGRTLYFVRGYVNRGEIKQGDIYMAVMDDNGKFSEPVKLGSNINTDRDEESVFIHPDNQTLYFSSNGHIGMGGLDIYMSKRQADGSWGPAINLGYPINTHNDENSLLVDPSGKIAYFASNRKDGFGGLDIYQFELPENVRPEKITYVKGKVYDAVTKQPLIANFEVYDLSTQNKVTTSFSDIRGNFLVTLTAGKNYMINVNQTGYLFYSDNFSLENVETSFEKPFILDIPLMPIDTGSVTELKNVFFDVNKWDLKPESKAELNKLIAFLKQNPSIKIELSGHTDNSGDKKFNQTLSTNRAKAVYDYLIKEGGINPQRLTYKGYGDTRPKVPNDSPENKAKNRRTEFKITGK